MDRLTAWTDESYFKFTFPEPEPLRKKSMISMDDVTFGYFGEDRRGTTYLLKNMELRIDWGDVIGILGPNGAGKSTLMKLIMQELKPVEGVVVHNKAMRIGYFAQHHMDTLELDKTPAAYLQKLFPRATNQEIYAKLGQFGLAEKARKQTIGTLSGGEKSRIAFAVLTWDAPHLLILDEPTNHLDLGTIQSLIRAIQNWNGSLLMVSHDQYFLNSICNEFWAVGDQKCRPFQTFDEAKKWCYSKNRRHVGVIGRDGTVLSTKKGAGKLNLDDVMSALGDLDASANPFSTASMVDEVLKQEERDAALRKKAFLERKRLAKAVPLQEASFNEKMLPQVQKFVDQEMSPDKILRRLQIWKSVDGDRDSMGVCERLAFACWRLYWEERCPVDDSTVLDSWCPLFQHVAPRSHPSLQRLILTACVSVWATSVSEGKRRATEDDALLNALQNLYFQDILSESTMLTWRDDAADKTKGRAEALGCLNEWIDDLA
jgi:ABC-type Mn2+/Zn2+ transport system ATPase subunit